MPNGNSSSDTVAAQERTTAGPPRSDGFLLKATPELQHKLKLGVYRELHRKGLLSEEQLRYLVGLTI